MALRDSVLYDKLHVKKYLGDARDRAGRMVPIPFEHTVVAGEASADTVNLCVLPANCEVVGYDMVTDGLVGAGITVIVGDSGDTDRFQASTVMVAAEARGVLAFAGARFRPTADTIVLLTYGVAAPTVGRIVRGAFYIVPGA